MSAADYLALTDYLSNGQRRVIDNLIEHLLPHPVGELRTGRVSLQAVAREVSKRNRPKTAHVLLCILDEFMPRLVTHCDDDMPRLASDAMALLRLVADHQGTPDAARMQFTRCVEANGRYEAEYWTENVVDDIVWSVLESAFDAITPGWRAAAMIGEIFDWLCEALVIVWDCDLTDTDGDMPKEEQRDFTRRIIGRIESKFAFAKASSAVLE